MKCTKYFHKAHVSHFNPLALVHCTHACMHHTNMTINSVTSPEFVRLIKLLDGN